MGLVFSMSLPRFQGEINLKARGSLSTSSLPFSGWNHLHKQSVGLSLGATLVKVVSCYVPLFWADTFLGQDFWFLFLRLW